MAPYRGPSRLNLTSIVMLLAVGALVYGLYAFGPIYLDALTVDHELRTAGNDLYKAHRAPEPERTQRFRQTMEIARKAIIQKASITDPKLEVGAEIIGNTALLTATYSVTVDHPLGRRPTTLHFKRLEKVDLTLVKWEN
jgi:hypothetical protein